MSVTEGGAALARRLPFEHVSGSAGATVRARWESVDAFVLFLATGAAVRIVAPLLADKRTDPAVVCVDEAGRFAISLVGGHEGGGNALAAQVAALLGAEPVITTASESGFRLSAETHPSGPRPHSDGTPADVPVTPPRYAPVPGGLAGGPTAARPGSPAGVVIGVGCSSDASPEAVRQLVEDALDGRTAVEVATIDRRRDHPAIVGLGLPIRAFTPEQLAAVEVPTPSEAVTQAVGTPSVAEAAALLAGGRLLTPKQKNAVATVAVATRPGRLTLVGLGPGAPEHRTPAATAAVAQADTVVGYGPYLDLCDLRPDQRQLRSPIGDEVVRAKEALAEAAAGRQVAMVCSGDSGVYAMASIVLELAAEAPGIDIDVVPGVTAALASAAQLGAPLGHDHCAISLSDLLTPWEAIERRVRAAAEADFVVSFYNPRSRGRDWQLPKAMAILAQHRSRTTPVGVVTSVGRPAQVVELTTVGEFDPETVGMTTTVVVGASTTRVIEGRMVTPRGYQC